MVGGWIVEKNPIVVAGANLIQYHVMDWTTGDELCVWAEPAQIEPDIGEEIWWQSGKIYFRFDRYELIKVGYSFRPVYE